MGPALRVRSNFINGVKKPRPRGGQVVAEPPSFAADIAPLWRRTTSSRCSSPSTCASYEDVREHAEDIWERLDDGSMPCDEEGFAGAGRAVSAWIDGGTAP